MGRRRVRCELPFGNNYPLLPPELPLRDPELAREDPPLREPAPDDRPATLLELPPFRAAGPFRNAVNVARNSSRSIGPAGNES